MYNMFLFSQRSHLLMSTPVHHHENIIQFRIFTKKNSVPNKMAVVVAKRWVTHHINIGFQALDCFKTLAMHCIAIPA